MTTTPKKTGSKITRKKKKNRKKSIFTTITHKSWSKHSARHHTLHRLPATIFSNSSRKLSHDGETVTVSQLPPPHTQLSHYSHPHTVLSQPPPPHTLHKKSSQPLSQIQQKKKKMAYASKYRFQEESVLPLHNTTVHLKYNEPSPAETVAEKETVTELFVLCIPLHKLSRPVQFVTCVLGVMFFYLLYGYTQEWIFSVEGFKPFGWYLTLVQFACYSAFGFSERKLRNEGRRRIPLRMYALISFLTVSTMGLSNSSLSYLNYPTQVIFKSCKLIPVMLGGMIIQGKKYTLVDGIALLCMSAGLIMFTLADSTVQPEFNKTGLLLISLALCADAVIGNVQEKALKQYSASNVEMVLFSYFIGFWYLLVAVTLTGSLQAAFTYCFEHPEIYLMAFVFSLTGYLGINFVLVLVRSFGALLAVTVTTFRKAVTMVLSFMLFTKPFTTQYIWAGLIVLLGILINLYNKNKLKVNNWIRIGFWKLVYLFKSQKHSTRSFQI
ncbi:adenosine 3'-phospho 5'-phosphosulfate transporter 2-like isoform X2 [Halichondria panicea]|uniref:adenosine 3'-phospho 5'-phosphosulfate transporter 2-like isoform X2 n=1 Tax=Halichondria panicea TaxID=6063 RepID=UPI00312B8F85